MMINTCIYVETGHDHCRLLEGKIKWPNSNKRGEAHLQKVIPQWPASTRGVTFYFYRT